MSQDLRRVPISEIMNIIIVLEYYNINNNFNVYRGVRYFGLLRLKTMHSAYGGSGYTLYLFTKKMENNKAAF